MKKLINKAKRKILFGFGKFTGTKLFQSLEKEDQEIIKKTIARTGIELTGLAANLDAVNYIFNNRIQGAIIECGVWRGGSMKAMMLKFIQKQDANREFILFDTFAGMTEPTKHDKKSNDEDARIVYNQKKHDTYTDWCYASIEDVQKFIEEGETGKLEKRFIKGDVAITIPEYKNSINKIALLRLDTDWYESTKIELECLFPKIEQNGILIIDDYGAWKGARKAVDEYFSKFQYKPLFFRVDETRRVMIKTKELC